MSVRYVMYNRRCLEGLRGRDTQQIERAPAALESLTPGSVAPGIPVATPRSELLIGRLSWFELDCICSRREQHIFSTPSHRGLGMIGSGRTL